MRPLREIRGLKYPDEFVVRHFFKRGLSERSGRVLELGSGTGNNLALYQAWDWACTGVDYDAAAIDDARHNLGAGPVLVQADLSLGLPPLDGPFEALIVPNLLCYLTGAQARAVLTAVKARLAPGCEVFVRTRLVDDYRYGRGTEEEPDGFRLATPETGEAGLFNRFYTQAGLVSLLTETLGLADRAELAVRFDNLQAGRRVGGNSDLVVWGTAA
ncbi:class I SAM-dependent methyltransferase [Phenylobacterium sp.]|uniref:class I SAM-dependent methyltransferase n=1 Tax=Phenylobacterium sp. TaxID=1871053 RepID=UPI0025FC359B|nr:class I SAM-dependent methyltransferase [Phenylobacterium sp.]MBX3485339.1 class I SAM-dependent methyltransferase [Phenylobacterium sp.]MCW5759594.1 class I SAM-dependent methyltransferase [Phenylobacterium sp.]